MACSGDGGLKKLNADATILAFGDSLTLGVGANDEDAYPQKLEKLINLKVINAGVSGEATAEGLQRLGAELDRYSPQLVILLEGGNDILRNYNLVQTKKNLAKMIEEIQSRNMQLILVGVPEKNIFSDSADLYQELSEQYNLVFDEKIIASLLKKQRYKSDPIHFNALGYEKLAERLREILDENGAL